MTVTVTGASQRVSVSGASTVVVDGRHSDAVSQDATTSVNIVSDPTPVTASSPSSSLTISSALGASGLPSAVLDIRDFGAVHNSDCTAAFNAAFAEAGSNYYAGGAFEYPGSTGAKVLVPKGIWWHSDLVVPNNVTLAGLGRTVSCMRAMPGTSVGITLSQFATLRDVFLRAGRVTGDVVRVVGGRTLVADVHIDAEGVSPARGLAVYDPTGTKPFYAPQFSNIIIEHVDGVGIYIGASDSQWSNTWLASGVEVGIVVAASNTSMTNTHVWERHSTGILVSPSGVSNRFINSYVETNYATGVVCYGFENSFIGGRIWKNGLGGIHVLSDDVGQTPSRNRFIGLEFRENKVTASLLFEGAFQNIVSSCVFSDPFFDATYAIEERDSAFSESDFNIIGNSNIVISADFSSGAVHTVGANSINDATVVT